MNKKLFTKGSVVSAALIALGIGATSALAFGPAIFSNLTTEQQETVQQARELRAEGNIEEARELIGEVRDEVRADRFAHREAVKEAIENNDYNAFQNLVTGARFGVDVTEGVFAKMVEAHELRQAGDIEGARSIMKELGIEKKGKHEHGDKGAHWSKRQ